MKRRGNEHGSEKREQWAQKQHGDARGTGDHQSVLFDVHLCDNEIDRDGERFPRATLEELAELFVGKSGIFDHEWTAKGQAARIYRTEIVEEEGV